MLTTTTVTTVRPAGDGDPYEAAATTTVLRSVAAHISSPSGADVRVGGVKVIIDAVLLIRGAADVAAVDRVTDDATGIIYRATWVQRRTGLGLDHTKAGLVHVTGAANG